MPELKTIPTVPINIQLPGTKPRFVAGIDCGVHTGIAVWDRHYRALVYVETVNIIRAMEIVLNNARKHSIELKIEDPNKRKWYGKNAGTHALQGVGSIKRDFKIWCEFAEYYKIPYTSVNPKDIKTKLKALPFKNITGWKGKTNQHNRDAGMMVFGS